MITLWHNPRCSKSRAALALLHEAGAEVEIRKYLEDAPDLAALHAVHAAMGKPPVIEMMRPKETAFKAAGLTAASGADALFQAMVDNPKLIERPIAIRDGRAVLGRPPERVLALLD